jgi:hypothetical protein
MEAPSLESSSYIVSFMSSLLRTCSHISFAVVLTETCIVLYVPSCKKIRTKSFTGYFGIRMRRLPSLVDLNINSSSSFKLDS